MERAGLIGAFVRMRAEVIALRLDDVRRERRAAEGIEVREARSHGRCGEAVGEAQRDSFAPGWEALLDFGLEAFVQEQVG